MNMEDNQDKNNSPSQEELEKMISEIIEQAFSGLDFDEEE